MAHWVAPRFIKAALAALSALRREFAAATVDAEPVPGPDGDYYRLPVVSDRFKRGAYVGRQDVVGRGQAGADGGPTPAHHDDPGAAAGRVERALAGRGTLDEGARP